MLALALTMPARSAWAGAWNEPAGQGLVIVEGLFDTGSRSWDSKGHVIATAPYHKQDGSVYLEYGVTDWLQIIAQPDVVSTTVGGSPGGHYTGFGTSAAGAQVQLPSWGPAVFALQGTLHLPSSQAERNPALTGNTSRDTDMRGLVGLPLQIGPWPAFINADAGYRVRGSPAPSEVHLDLTGGLRPLGNVLLLVQSFTTVPTEPGSTYFPRSTYTNLQGSAVYDLDAHWSVQAGVFGTVWGRSALRERGLLSGVWYRF